MGWMKKKMLVLPLLCCLFLLSCGADQEGSDSSFQDSAALQPGTYRKISSKEAKEMMDDGGATVVDVRTEAEYREKHIPGAVLVPNETIRAEAPEELPNKETVLLVYCRSGVRSKAAAEKLISLGYQNVYDFGGIIDWPYETVAGEE